MKMFRILIGLTLALCLVLVSFPAAAQQAEEPGVIYHKTTKINFTEGDTIKGDLNKPDGVIVDVRPTVQHKNLIQTRDSFSDKIIDSAKGL